MLTSLTIVDDATQQTAAIEVARDIPGHGVSRLLDRLVVQKGLRQFIRMDDGMDFFCGKSMVSRLT